MDSSNTNITSYHCRFFGIIKIYSPVLSNNQLFHRPFHHVLSFFEHLRIIHESVIDHSGQNMALNVFWIWPRTWWAWILAIRFLPQLSEFQRRHGEGGFFNSTLLRPLSPASPRPHIELSPSCVFWYRDLSHYRLKIVSVTLQGLDKRRLFQITSVVCFL